MTEAGSTAVASTRASMHIHIHAALILNAVVPYFPSFGPFLNFQTLDGVTVVNRARVLYDQQKNAVGQWVSEI